MTKIDPLKSGLLCANGGPKKCRITCDDCRKIQHPKKIRIPKLNPEHLYDVKIQRGGVIETKNAVMVRCIKQEIEGVTIPNGFEIWIPGNINSIYRGFSSVPLVHVPGWKLNSILKMLVLNSIR